MPSSHPDSSGSPPHSATPSAPPGPDATAAPATWRANLWLFLLTIGSVFVTGASMSGAPLRSPEGLRSGAQFAGALLSILVAHELGHYVAARIHKVDASLPYFIPLPILSPFGTMGAVIRMRGTIPTRRALLDIGAAGPLAGLVFAIPMYVWGVAHSQVVPLGEGGFQLGNSLILRVLDHAFGPTVPEGMDILLSPVAFAGWAGFFVTMINLFPMGQLDGGHVAYALFGPRQDKFAQVAHRATLALFFVNLFGFFARDVHAGYGLSRIGKHVGSSMFWLVWFEVVAILGTLGSQALPNGPPKEQTLTVRTRLMALLGLVVVASLDDGRAQPLLWVAWFVGLGVLLAMEVRGGAFRVRTLADHPATGREPLGKGRAAIAIVTLLFFVLLFMPTPFAM